ncbi:MAG: hypothetical protein ABIQ08_09790 [Duganella sp.]
MMTSLHTTTRVILGAAIAVALLAGCNKRPADQPQTPAATPESTTPSTPSTTPGPAPDTTPPPAATPPAGSGTDTTPPGQ